MKTRCNCTIALAVLFATFVLSGKMFAQGTTATISGTVSDSSGAVVPNAQVEVRNTETGISRSVQSDPAGRYSAPNLSVGAYEVHATAQGFKSELQTGLRLTVGQMAVVNFSLNPGNVSESVTVAGEVPLISTVTSEIGALVNREQIRDLPLNGRDYTQLAALQPGVIQYREQSRELNRGTGTRFNISGARSNQVGFRLNGLDISDGAGTTPGSATGHNLGLDAIQEFQVLTNTFPAEYGKAAGGVINVIHKSGTNQLHGALFEYLRNSALDAPNYFDLNGKVAPFKRNQFGASAGGPIVKDRAFFFGAYEGLRERLAISGQNTVPSPGLKSGAFGPVNPAVKPYLDLIPLPSIPTTKDTGIAYISAATRATENYYVGKGDYTISISDTLSGSFTMDRGEQGGPSPRDGIVTSQLLNKNRYYYVTSNETHIFSPSVLNTFRFGFNRSNTGADREPIIAAPSNLEFVPGVHTFAFDISGLDTLAFVTNTILDRRILLDSYQFGDTVGITRGAHSIKFGFDLQRSKVGNKTSSRTDGGRWGFGSVADFAAGIATIFQADDPEGDSSIPTIRQNVIGMFAQDDIRVTPRLTANLGMRYEFITLPTSEKANESTLLRLEDPALTTGRTFFQNPSLKNFGPRVGLAWDVTGDQKTAIRAGFGLYYDQITSYYYLPVIQNNPPFGLTRTLNKPANALLPFPNAFQQIKSGAAPSLFSLSTIENKPGQPYRIQYNLGVQRQIDKDTGFAVYYVGARGVHSTQFTLNANSRIPVRRPDGKLFFAPNAPIRNPKFGVVQYRSSGGDSYYNGFQSVLSRRVSGGLQFQGSYTWSTSIDTGSVFSFSSEGLNTVVMQSLYDLRAEKGLSSFDVRHNFTLSTTYDLPKGDGWSPVVKGLASSWQIGGIVSMSAGLPFTPILGGDRANVNVRSKGDHLRPDLIPGGNNNPVTPGKVAQYFDPLQFDLPEAGTLGNLARNTLSGPGLAQVDFTAKKRYHFTEQKLLEFRAEIFNLLDRANFRVPIDANRTIFNARNQRLTTGVGSLTDTTTSARQMQFSLRLEF